MVGVSEFQISVEFRGKNKRKKSVAKKNLVIYERKEDKMVGSHFPVDSSVSSMDKCTCMLLALLLFPFCQFNRDAPVFAF